MHEAKYLPVGGEASEVLTHALEQCHGRALLTNLGISLVWRLEVAVYDVVHQRRHLVTPARHGKVLDGADSEMATSHSGQDRTRLDLVSNDRFAGGNGGECAGSRHT